MGSKTIKGITIQIDGNASGLGKVLKEVDQESKKLATNLKSVDAALKLDPTNVDLLAQKQRILGDSIESTSKRLGALKQAQEEAAKSVGNYDAWAAAYKPIQAQITATKDRIKELQTQQAEMAETGDISSEAYESLGTQINQLNGELRDLRKTAKAVSDEFGNPISQDEYDKLQREIVFTDDKLKKLSKELDETESEMADLGKDTSKAAKEMDDFADAADDASKESAGLGSILSGGVVTGAGAAVAAVGAVVGGLIAAEEQSREYRAEMGKLNAAYESSKFSAETATATYKTLQGVIGETDQTVEAAQQIALLADSEERAAQWAGYAAGVVGKFGDALQPETFYESANETLKLGEATGAFTQMLEGCGMNVEKFNADLAACTTEQEKQALMLQVTEEALGDAAKSYRKVNAETIRANEANEAWNEALAAVGGTMTPVITNIKLMGAEFLGGLAKSITTGSNLISSTVEFVQSSSAIMLSTVQANTEMRLNNIRAAYQENGGGIKGITAATMEAVGGAFADGWNVANQITGGKLNEMKNTISSKLTDAKNKVKETITSIKGFFGGFEFKWPKLTLPHFTVSPKGWKIGDLLKGSIPKLSISWFKDGGILPSTAIFGAYNGKLLGGGEAGKEAILPLDSFYQNLEAIMSKYSNGHSGVMVKLIIEHFENSSGQDIDELAERVALAIDDAIARKEAAFS